MPGKNSKYDKSKARLLEKLFVVNMHYVLSLVIIITELVGMFRLYYSWPERRYSFESLFLSIFWVVADFSIFKGLFVAHDSDPGYIIPSQQMCAQATVDACPSCRKCEAVRAHTRIHHCRRCNRCVDFMDHHCSVTDNCVGK